MKAKNQEKIFILFFLIFINGCFENPYEQNIYQCRDAKGDEDCVSGYVCSEYGPSGGGFWCIKSEIAEEIQGMSWVEGGYFASGCVEQTEICEGEYNLTEIYLDSFFIDKKEVTVDDYRKCVTVGACTQISVLSSDFLCNYNVSDKGSHPVNCVDYSQASDYCGWKNKRLPSEYEWEKAARGMSDTRIYPWGDDTPTCLVAVFENGCGLGETSTVGSKPLGVSPYGVFDMSGNVFEWVIDVDDVDGSNSLAVAKGGGFQNGIDGNLKFMRISARFPLEKDVVAYELGFRCVR